MNQDESNMMDIRISIRFKKDNARDMQAWNLLREHKQAEKTSINSIVISSIIESLENTNGELTAEEIAKRVSDMLIPILTDIIKSLTGGKSLVSPDVPSSNNAIEPQEDNESEIDAAALENFIDVFQCN